MTLSTNNELTIEEKRALVNAENERLLAECNKKFKDLATELFFLQHGGNYSDFGQFKKRPSQLVIDHLAQNPIVQNESDKNKINQETNKINKESDTKKKEATATESAPKAPPSIEPAPKPILKNVKSSNPISPSIVHRMKRVSRNQLSDVYHDTINSQEEILERAKQEAVVQRRVADLRRQGLWSQRRLPKVQEPPRNKAHWDYLLEEMRWLAADFAQERKWKRIAARKLVRMVSNYHKDQEEKVKKAEKDEQLKLRRIASKMARQVKTFWSNIEKVVEYKQRSLLDEKRMKALDLHLSYIVDQTAKYSDWLTQGLNQPEGSRSPSVSKASSSAHASDDDFLPQGVSSDDEETIAVEEENNDNNDAENDEVELLKKESEVPFEDLLSQLPTDLVENIGKPLEEDKELAEEDKKEDKDEESTSTEKEVKPDVEIQEEQTIIDNDDDVLSDGEEKNKPTPISLRRSARKRQGSEGHEVEPKKLKTEKEDTKDFNSSDEEGSTDDEETMKEEEELGEVDHKVEINNLQAEGEMPIEELMKMYGGAFQGTSPPPTPASQSEDESSEESEAEDNEEENEQEEIGMDYLLKLSSNKDEIKQEQKDKLDESTTREDRESTPNKEITDVAAEAQSLQPTGHTLATTQVVTPIPPLLRHTLREYQHIGLDWLVTMFNKRLNGILADEMGLGKTIQTIALLAHLACDKGVWGPHLIVVPTSVMLNWEMEFKKWCPGFKILTYYGSQKERKLKRTGWTKSNAFHVCITSYKLVLQDHTSFRRKRWRYLILDEAQNIKNFKSQRWQTLLNFNSQRRLLLTGTPLQNNLMELWSLMHFLMPHVFQSHKEFKEWFSNPMTGMIDGTQEFNEKIIRRLHKVLRPFLLRRIKKDVEKQMPNKYEHVIKCHLSKRQRFLYEDFMSRASTKETLAGGHFMSVINVLMQLRKVCNHPNLFEPRPTLSPFVTPPLVVRTPMLCGRAMEKNVFEEYDFSSSNFCLERLCNISSLEFKSRTLLKTTKKLIEEISSSTKPVESPTKYQISAKVEAMVREKLFKAFQNQKFMNPTLSLSKPLGSVQIQQKNQTNKTQVTVKTDSDSTRPTPTSQSITLQYQTAQGTRWATIPNGQIRHLPGGVVQIVTSRTATPVPVLSQQATNQPTEQNVSTDSSKDTKKNGKRISSESYSKMVARKKAARHDDILTRLSCINEHRCTDEPHYLPHNTISLLRSITQSRYENTVEGGFPDVTPRISWRRGFSMNGKSKLIKKQPHQVESDVINELVKLPSTRLQNMKGILERFVCVVPKVVTRTTDHQVSHPSPWKHHKLTTNLTTVQTWLSKKMVPLHQVLRNQKVQFPEVRLIEYDCGKLQILNILLRRFWLEKHRILIFTQMTRVLDILEAFLSYHGYRYLRLDGSTNIEQRMIRMERFNNDPKIFCFILSTRSGGIGVNLTGADTVVFYDSDWNPTMDAQAQDRCHRIGQTRDVHIYRLISDRTVEENILKKANQKRLLGDLAIEGGSFTTAFFKQQALKDLFDAPSGLEELAEQTQQPKLTARQKAIEDAKNKDENSVSEPAPNEDQKPTSNNEDKTAPTEHPGEEGKLEDALLETEDQEDAVAAKMLKIEQNAVMDEFTEVEDKDDNEKNDLPSKFKIPKGSKVEEELRTIYDELNPIEKYALNFLEISREETNDFELQVAEDAVERSKKDWELTHLMALKQEEEQRMEEEDEIFYTREDATNEIWIDENTGEIMPIWLPPTPPQDDHDFYVDPTHILLYKPNIMSEAQLPPLVGKKEKRRTKQDMIGSQSQSRKLARLDINIPKSLFNRNKKSEVRKSKVQPIKTKVNTTPTKNLPHIGQALPNASTPTLDLSEPIKTGSEGVSGPDWVINEEWALLQAVQQILEIPLTLLTLMPAHTLNWHLVADMVNSVSSVYRSPKQCKSRYEEYILPREDRKTTLAIQDAMTPKKKLKSLKTPKTKLTKTQKTNVLYAGDSNHMFTALYSNRFDACKVICNKRNPPKTSGGSGQFQRNPKHTNILHDCGITYDKPLHPVQVAAARAKRIQNQKKNSTDQQLNPSLPTSGQTLSSGGPPSGHSIAISQVGNTLVVANGNQIVGKAALQGGTQGLGQLTAIPISGGTSNIVVGSSFPRRVNQTQVGGAISVNQQVGGAISVNQQVGGAISINQQQVSGAISIQGTAKLQTGKGGSSLTLRAISGTSNQALSSQTPLVTITTATAGGSSTRTRPTITYPTQGATQIQKLTTMQQIKQGKQQNIQTSTLKQQVKQLRVSQQGTQHLAGTIVTGNPSNAILAGGKKVQLAKMTAQEFEILMKQQRPVKTVPHRQQQVQIAPVRAQHQAHQVQMIAAQQATQASSKPLPITVPVTNIAPTVNLTGLTVPSSAHNKQMIVTGTQGAGINQLILQQHLLKQQQQSLQSQQQQLQQQQSRQVFVSKQQKQVYSPVVAHQLISSQGKFNRIVQQQQQNKRRIATSKSSSQNQQSVALTVTKFLPSQSTAQPIRHTILPQNTQLAQQIALPLSGATAIVTPSNLTNQQSVQRVVSQGQLQLPRVRQIHPGIQTVVGPTVVASAPITMQRSLATTLATNQTQVLPQQQQQQIHIHTNAPQTSTPISQPSPNVPQVLTISTDTQQQQQGQDTQFPLP